MPKQLTELDDSEAVQAFFPPKTWFKAACLMIACVVSGNLMTLLVLWFIAKLNRIQ